MTTELLRMNGFFVLNDVSVISGPYLLQCESGVWLYDYPYHKYWMRLKDDYIHSFMDKLTPIHKSALPKKLAHLPKYLWMFNSPLSWIVTGDAHAHTGSHYLKMPEKKCQ